MENLHIQIENSKAELFEIQLIDHDLKDVIFNITENEFYNTFLLKGLNEEEVEIVENIEKSI